MFGKVLNGGLYAAGAIAAMSVAACAADRSSQGYSAISPSSQGQVVIGNQGQFPAPRYDTAPPEAPYALTGEESQQQATQWVPTDRVINVGNATIIIPSAP